MKNNKSKNRRIFLGTYLLIIALFVLFLYYKNSEIIPNEIITYYTNSALIDTGAENVVTGIYLNYRLYDTFFEALMLLVSVIGIIHFSRHDGNDHLEDEDVNKVWEENLEQSQLMTSMGGFLYPFILIFGAYIIFNGHKSPGGGFQGGAVLASVFIIKYLVMPTNDIHAEFLYKTEKILFFLIISTGIIFSFGGLLTRYNFLNVPFLIFMNTLIGIKVFCGLSIVFYRFVFFESR
ncbi:MnhB domain-containing protein [Clostridium grantii]|uniref:Multicomponent Na+:H+ antiporter subunit B n=1 Tax=Clostridium grantii DSM 8605 TaxID=1121316 RepID=A0A1M5RMB8_9CLOT|nr:MnhB domain-containing protein [Clostridium grantii]SHH27309.1 multicomponent Na+:H+ antiporter subunit B [Clostridium grantii DSM 8605]